MSDLLLYVGNKNYSSWSIRPWLAMTAAGVPFRDELIPFDDDNGNPAIKAVSPNGKVPLLVDGSLQGLGIPGHHRICRGDVPRKPLWPESRQDSGPGAIDLHARWRRASWRFAMQCPMNLRIRKREAIDVSGGVVGEVDRIETIWRDCLQRSGGPFLFGSFSAADAMFAPVVNRFEIYLSDRAVPTRFPTCSRSRITRPGQAWAEDAAKEPWIVPEDEV